MGRVGPVIMAHPVARARLERAGVVHSFRTSDRTTGETHYRTERTGTKEADVRIEKMTDELSPTARNLSIYRVGSGFQSVEAWQNAIKEVHGGLDCTGYVYRVELI